MPLQLILCDANLVPLASVPGPITGVIDARIVLEELDQFTEHSVTLSGSQRRNLAALTPLTTVKIVEVGTGTVAIGLILDPEQQINDQGDRIILRLPNITEQCRFSSTGLGFVRSAALGTIVSQVGAMRAGWSATMTDTTPVLMTSAPVIWQTTGAVLANGATLTKTGTTAAFDCGGISQQVIQSGDCSLSFQADSNKTLKLVGLTSSGVYSTLDLYWYCSVNTASVYEFGVLRATVPYVSGDQLTVAIENGGAVFRQNGGAIWNNGTVPSYPLRAAADLYSGEVDGAQLAFMAAPAAAWWATRMEDATVLGGLTELAKATFKHLRQAKDSTGTPLRAFEFGAFGAAASLRLVSPDSGNANAIQQNPDLRVITDLRHVTEASKLINVVTPLGGGQGDQQVTLRRCWRIVNDPTYIHYGVARYFPEYDTRFPISDPHNIGYGLDPVLGIQVANRRRVTYDGRFQYDVWVQGDGVTVQPSYAQYGEMRGGFTDAQFTYVDASVNNQEMTERTLYAAAVAKLKWYSQPHETYTVTTGQCTAPGVSGALANRQGVRTRAGDLVTVAYKRVGQDAGGVFTETNVNTTLNVMRVERTYTTDGKATDTWTLSNLGRYMDQGQNTATDQQRQIEALRLVPTSSVSMFVTDTGIREIDAAPHTMVQAIPMPKQLFRVQQCLLQLNLYPARSTINSASTNDGAHQHDVTIPALLVSGALPLHGHSTGQASHLHSGMNLDHGHTDTVGVANATVDDITAAIRTHSHTITVSQGGNPGTGDSSGILYGFGGTNNIQAVGQGGTITMSYPGTFTATGSHAHAKTGGVTPTSGLTRNTPGSGALSGTANADNYAYPIASTLPATVLTNGAGLNGTHHHTLQPGIFDTDLTKSVTIQIDSGDGVLVDRTAALGGPWSTSMPASVDVTQWVSVAPGKTVRFQASAGFVGAANPTGLCAVQMSELWVVELSGIASTIYAA